NIGTSDSELVQGVRRSAAEHGLAVEELSAVELRKRYPQFRFTGEYVGVLEREAGFLYVEDCVRGHIEAARQHGATIMDREPVVSWTATPAGVEVVTERHRLSAGRLVITAGPWAGRLLADRGRRLRVM